MLKSTLKTLAVVCGVALGVLSAGDASAQCTDYVLSFADGRVIGPFTSNGSTTIFAPYFQASPGHSYSIEVLSATDALAGAATTGAVSEICPTADHASVSSNETTDPRGDSRSYRVTTTTATSGYIVTRVPTGTFYYSVSDTTLYNSSWSTAGSYATQWGLQNTTGSAITGTLTVKESFGGSATYTRAVTLPANSTTFVTTFDAFAGGPIPTGRGGSATFTHSGPANTVLGDAYLVGSSGTAVPSIFRALRDVAR